MENFDFTQDEDLNRAVAMAERAHKGQVRKKDGVTPYVTHAKTVMALLESCFEYERSLMSKHDPISQRTFFDVFYKDVVIAGVLHDVVEDTNKDLSRSVKLEMIKDGFGPGVAEIVDVMSEWKEDAYDDRKNTQLKRILDASRGAKLVKCADNIANLGETVQDYKDGDLNAWKVYKVKPTQVVENHINTLGALEDLDGNPLYAQFSEIVKQSMRLAVDCEARLGTTYWDEKAKSAQGVIGDDFEAYFRETYKSNMPFERK